MKTSPTLHINRQSHHFDINVRAVWGAIATGNGQSHFNEFLATVDSPGMHQRTFNKIENDINVWWNGVLQDDLKQAVEEEKAIAIAKGSFHEGSSIDLRVMHLLYPPQTLFVVGYTVFTLSVRASVTLCFLNILKSHCWIFIKPCKHVHICKTNTLNKKVRARGQFY